MRVNGNRSSHAKKPSMESCREVVECECGVHITAPNFFYKISSNLLLANVHIVLMYVFKLDTSMISKQKYTPILTNLHTC